MIVLFEIALLVLLAQSLGWYGFLIWVVLVVLFDASYRR